MGRRKVSSRSALSGGISVIRAENTDSKPFSDRVRPWKGCWGRCEAEEAERAEQEEGQGGRWGWVLT